MHGKNSRLISIVTKMRLVGYILGLVFGVFGGFITPAFSFILVSLFIRCTMSCEILAQPAELPW